ncbi:hypothetical protein G9A89_022209 [Geosiphon pyriformis]|nr:hypothetical protein G9A89_022209 [Geosiphon pyriformis]
MRFESRIAEETRRKISVELEINEGTLCCSIDDGDGGDDDDDDDDDDGDVE